IIQALGSGSLSAGTHADGWAVDIRTWRFSQATVDKLVALARRCGASATWYRTKDQGFDPHIHLVVDSGTLRTAASYQTAAVRAGYNGLGAGGRRGQDTHPAPSPWRTGAQGIDYMEETLMALSADDKAWLMRQLGVVPSAVWSATWGTDTAGARLARAAEAGPATRPLTYGDRQVSLREVLGQTSAQVAALSGQIAGLTTALGQIAGGTVDLAAVEAAAKRGAEQALAGAKVTLELGDQ
ncbi:MAG TPA: hypothetical protein K8V15_10035, partial [Tessaracoccus flavescens]|nr:hypothetical protein [Tessaracoccus flavescens]